MCGIAGLIHRGKSSNVGEELQSMLQALKHRGPDSTGYALYANNDGQNFILRFKVGENVGEGSTSVNEDESVYNERKKIVDKKLSELGAPIVKEEKLTPYSYRYEIKYDNDLMEFSKAVESIENVISNAKNDLNLPMPKIGLPLRVALLGRAKSPQLNSTIYLIEKEKVIDRLGRSLEVIAER